MTGKNPLEHESGWRTPASDGWNQRPWSSVREVADPAYPTAGAKSPLIRFAFTDLVIPSFLTQSVGRSWPEAAKSLISRGVKGPCFSPSFPVQNHRVGTENSL
jgi:hypothetical protein